MPDPQKHAIAFPSALRVRVPLDRQEIPVAEILNHSSHVCNPTQTPKVNPEHPSLSKCLRNVINIAHPYRVRSRKPRRRPPRGFRSGLANIDESLIQEASAPRLGHIKTTIS